MQFPKQLFRLFFVSAFAFLLIGCGDSTPSNGSAATQPATQPESVRPRVVSLSPAVTDLIVAMGGTDRLVGISTFDVDPAVSSLPRVGDYENANWEKIAELRPTVMIVQGSPDRIPAATRTRAKQLNAALYVARIETVADVMSEATLIGEQIGLPKEGEELLKKLRGDLDELRRDNADKPRVRTLIVTSSEGTGVAGPNTYLNDLLEYAGGINAVPQDRPGYSEVDRELLLKFNPDVVIQLLPAATPAQLDQAKAFWQSMPELSATKSGRIVQITEPWALMPCSRVAELAQKIEAAIHAK